MIAVTEVPITELEGCIPENQASFYRAVQMVIESADVGITDQNFYYNKYLPALLKFDATVVDMADGIWMQKDFDWAPKEVGDQIRKGIKAGFLWAKTELANG